MRQQSTPQPATANHVGLLLSTDWGYTREVLRGAASVCAEKHYRRMRLHPDVCPPPAQLLPMLCGGLGTLSEPCHEELSQRLRLINTSGRRLTPKIPQIVPDNRAVGMLAGRHLLDQGARSLAYYGDHDTWFSAERRVGFEEALAKADKHCETVPSRERFLAWLESLPKPIGVLAANDHMAAELVEAALATELRVPDHLMVVGVDNDDLVCQTSNPPLTSVDCGWRTIGMRAAEMLIRWIETGRRPPALTVVPPAGLVVRQTSNLASTDDPQVNLALEIIRREAPRAMPLKQLLDRMGMSRRNLDRRFKQHGRASPSTEILRTQIERACQLLADTSLPLDRVAAASGLRTQRQLRLVFGREMGQSPTAYRQRFRGA